MCCLTDWARSSCGSWDAGATDVAPAPVGMVVRKLLGGGDFAVRTVDFQLLTGAIQLHDFNLVQQLIAVTADRRFLGLATGASLRRGDSAGQGGRGVLNSRRFEAGEQLLELLVALFLYRARGRAELVLRQLLAVIAKHFHFVIGGIAVLELIFGARRLAIALFFGNVNGFGERDL